MKTQTLALLIVSAFTALNGLSAKAGYNHGRAFCKNQDVEVMELNIVSNGKVNTFVGFGHSVEEANKSALRACGDAGLSKNVCKNANYDFINAPIKYARDANIWAGCSVDEGEPSDESTPNDAK